MAFDACEKRKVIFSPSDTSTPDYYLVYAQELRKHLIVKKIEDKRTIKWENTGISRRQSKTM